MPQDGSLNDQHLNATACFCITPELFRRKYVALSIITVVTSNFLSPVQFLTNICNAVLSNQPVFSLLLAVLYLA